MKWIVILLFLSGLCPAQPEILWERTYFPGTTIFFLDVHETADEGFIVAGGRFGGSSPNACLFRFSPTGEPMWEVSEPWDYQKTQWVEELPDGEGFIATGVCRVNPDDSYAFCLIRVNADGNLEWSRVLDVENSTEYGTCVLPLPDDGYAVTAYRSSTDLGRQAWILRTDSQGDTLWTREWGWEYNDEARRVLLVDGALTVLMHGRLESTSSVLTLSGTTWTATSSGKPPCRSCTATLIADRICATPPPTEDTSFSPTTVPGWHTLTALASSSGWCRGGERRIHLATP